MAKKQKSKKKSWINGNYKKCYDFLKESKNYVLISLGIFCLFLIIGFAFPIFYRQGILELMKQMVLKFEGLSLLETISYIFLNNIKVALMVIIFGIGFAIFPIVNSIVNGYLLGFVARGASEVGGILSLTRILPYGIFELPAVIIALGLGMKLGIDMFRKNRFNSFKHNLKESARFFVFVIIPLLIIAAIIEGLLVFYYK